MLFYNWAKDTIKIIWQYRFNVNKTGRQLPAASYNSTTIITERYRAMP
jgi:hypothetical protein